MTALVALLAAAGPWAAFLALLVAVAVAMATDRLVTRGAVKRAIEAERRAAEAEKHRADDWFAAYTAANARADLERAQLAEVLSVLRLPREAA